ncbi:MAG: bifunctional phosphopantothenoylcysteine decarboxylase/phosphopantothenate--cysteine ligase CoaBC [Rhizobiaceae bacterium]|nr:bifunctional phosphopantothenoylcysteine decarboxylase/phosphopantothenate--cysteine ligase CoaBC [Rhizobiaceae bacterium]
MASITIRNLDEATKQLLRERAAHNGRSMEEEVRHLLRDSTQAPASFPAEPAIATVSPEIFDPLELDGKRILLIITGGIAAYKCLDLIRRLRERGASVRPVMTEGARAFITPLVVGALANDKVFLELFSREDEQDVGHISLARECDLVLVAPATADFIAKMALGIANDLASTIVLASNRPLLVAPAMNPIMWAAAALQRNMQQLRADGVHVIGPMRGEMAESGEAGTGRMAEPLDIVAAVRGLLAEAPGTISGPLTGKRAIVTSGPTHEPIDPVRYIANRSSGKQGHAIAAALAALGAQVTLVSGPVTITDPPGVLTVHVETAREMLDAVEQLLPADIAVMVAAVADWRASGEAGEKIKKKPGEAPPPLQLTENPDILKTVGHHAKRPALVVGFAAETQNLIDNAKGKLQRKGADWIVANDVSPAKGVMGGDRNHVRIVSRSGVEDWPEMDKTSVAARLAEKIAERFETTEV